MPLGLKIFSVYHFRLLFAPRNNRVFIMSEFIGGTVRLSNVSVCLKPIILKRYT